MRFLIALALCLCIFGAQAANYAVLVASSNDYTNYRHQADVFHTYQVLVKHGMPAENIIVMAFDDIANNRRNPFPGQVFNVPTAKGGYDVYRGVKIDYKGMDVNPRTFINVITGNSAAVGGRRVLKTTSQDNIFMYMSDHGSDGIVAFADETYLYADDLNRAFQTMYQKRMYKKIVFYLEACHSGSMFENILSKNMNIYALTAANPHESSYAEFCGYDAVVNGQNLYTCLGDEFSNRFITHMENENLSVQTLFEQFGHVKSSTAGSHVMQYGDLSFNHETLHNYQSNAFVYRFNKPNVRSSLLGRNVRMAAGWNQLNGVNATNATNTTTNATSNSTKVNSRDVRLHVLKALHKAHPEDKKLAMQIIEEIAEERRFDLLFKRLQEKFHLRVGQSVKKIDFPCYKKRMDLFKKTCGVFSDYSIKYAGYIAQTCETTHDAQFEMGLTQACLKHKFIDIGV